MKSFFKKVVWMAALLLPAVATAYEPEYTTINTGQTLTFALLISKTIGLINQVIPVLFALGLVFFMWSGVQYVTKAGEGGGEARTNMLWGIIVLFVLFSIWGILNVLCVSFLGNSCH